MIDRAPRLADLRAHVAGLGLDGVLVPRADEHLGETVPACAERLAWLTGFSGSAGLAIVLLDRAIVFSDGRYVLQLAAETDPALFARGHLTETPPRDWLRAVGRALRIGYDPRVVTEHEIERLAGDAVTLVPLAANPVDRVWADRPPPPPDPARPHPEAFSGRASADKRAAAAAALAADGHDAAVLTDPASVAWLLNLRGTDLPTTPFALGFAILHADERVDLFMAPDKLDAAMRAHLGNAVRIEAPDRLGDALRGLAGATVRVDREAAPAWFADTLRAAGAAVVSAPDPCALPKAIKNPVELDGMRASHRRDGVAMVRFLHWLDGCARRDGALFALDATAPLTEIAASDRLRAFRAEDPRFLSDSFDAISGAGEHGAVIHYRATPDTDRALGQDEFYLIDSGGQYEDGTTDVTRTLWTGPGPIPAPLAEQFTRVLKGHVALAAARFPDGVTGHRLDALARASLWQAGLDYDHGTGHGVGSVLSVHEGPASISALPKPAGIRAGMVLSNEPGCYVPGSHGIRIENLLAVRRAAVPGDRPFLEFETLTLAPIDRRAILVGLLEPGERAWIDGYHARVLAELGPSLDPGPREWLARACAALPDAGAAH